MKRVVIYRRELLPVSETFIRDQCSALLAWQPVLMGLSSIPNGLQTPGVPREIIRIAPSRHLTSLRLWAQQPVGTLVTRLREMNATLAHAHFGTDATEIWPSVRSAGLPLLVTLHGYDINIDRQYWEAGFRGRLQRAYPHRLLSLARESSVHFIAVSRAIHQRAIEYGIPDGKIRVAYIGIDTQQYTPGKKPIAARPRRILFVGRMVEKKAPLLMVRAFATLHAETPETELVMIGDGPLLEDAKSLAATLNAPVCFLGARSSHEVLAQMHESRVLCLPSITASNGDAEGFGLVLLEAQACGVPVVTSARGGATEGMIDGETGFRFAEGEEGALVDRLQAVLMDEQTNMAMSLRAAKFAREHFDLALCTRQLERIYDRHSL